jgi:hypothetical protein
MSLNGGIHIRGIISEYDGDQASPSYPKFVLSYGGTNIVENKVYFPITKDGWNIQINGSDYDSYVAELIEISDVIDEYKSNLIVNFLSSPHLIEFDTHDQKTQKILQIYGQSFDRTKKFIDNIAYMRNVTYDTINNIPDLFLKNLSNTLGFTNVELFEQSSIEELLYTTNDSVFSGLNKGKNAFEYEVEFYRRLLVNLAYIYKSKGTRKGVEFLLKFIGAPEPLIKIDEYIYEIVSVPEKERLISDIDDVLRGTKEISYASYDQNQVLTPTLFSVFEPTILTTVNDYTIITLTGSTNQFNGDSYPVDLDTGLPKNPNLIDYFYQNPAFCQYSPTTRVSSIQDYNAS